MDAILAHAYEFGPLWMMVFLIAFLLWYFGNKLMDVYSQKTEAQIELEKVREERKREELMASIEHDRKTAETNGQMVASMRDSNTLMSAIKTLMESLIASNGVIHQDLKASQTGSKQMQSDMQEVKQKVDFIYRKEELQ